MGKEEEIRIKNQKAEEAMRRARKAQQANEKMQRELQAAARELARHQELAKKASMQKAAAQEAAVSRKSVTGSMQSQEQGKSAAALKQQEASREAARQAMIYEAAKRRAEKKEAARKAAELIAAQREAEKKIHHTSPETRELQNLLLQQISDIMEEKEPEGVGAAAVPEQRGSKTAEISKEEQQNASGNGISEEKKHTDTKPLDSETVQDFGDLVVMDVHSGELQPESSAVLEKKGQEQHAVHESEEPEEKLESWGRMGTWFQTFCWMHIPVVGFWYMVVIACRRNTSKEKKAFARAYILYRMLVLILACTLLYIFYRMGLSFVEQILSYIEAHQ